MSARLLVDPVSEAAMAERVGQAAFVLSLRARGVRDLALLRAMELVPREFFAPRRYADLSRSDVALPLPFGQTMTAPGAVAGMLSALACQPGQRILEIGTGSGYVAGLLAAMGGAVTSLERIAVLAESASLRLRAAGLSDFVEVIWRDGFGQNLPPGRFDRIVVNGALPGAPVSLLPLLAAGGRLVSALASPEGPRLMAFSREADGSLVQSFGAPLRISSIVVPAAPETGLPEAIAQDRIPNEIPQDATDS